MKIPLSWLREFTPVPNGISLEALEAAFVNVGFEVESIDQVGADVIGPLVVGKVRSIEELTEHKKPIRYVGLDCGEGQTRFVICGASNFLVDDLVVVALPGALLPGDFAILARETYGKISDGMICSARELRTGDDHSGIIVLPIGSALVGADAKALLEIEDVILEISVLADRGYALSARGLARELAGSLGLPFSDPALKDYESQLVESAGSPVSVTIEDFTGADFIAIRTVDNVDPTAPSPLWLQRRIQKCGMRSISIAVDITNYVMLELGQPLHAFDAAKIEGSLRIRRANSEKVFTTLDGQVRTLAPETLLVCDDKKALALAGTMGGLESEVTMSTRRIALEAAHFDPISIAKNSRTQRLSSEASRRLERAVDPALVDVASARASALLIELTGAKYIGVSRDGKLPEQRTITFLPSRISLLLGFNYSAAQISGALTAVACELLQTQGLDLDCEWTVSVPLWRPDLVSLSDLAEEVARINGLELIPSNLPTGKSGANLSPLQQRRRSLGLMLANSGFTEVITSPFVSTQMMTTLGFTGDRAKAFRVVNPMSEEFPLLRTHLTPGLLTALARNISRGAKDVALFEIGSVFRNIREVVDAGEIAVEHRPSEEQIEGIFAALPDQPLHIAGVVSGNGELKGWWGSGRKFDWSDAVSMAIRIVEETGNQYQIVSSDFAPWHTGRCAEIIVAGKAVAHAGELHPRVIAELALPERSCAFVVALSALPFHAVIKANPVWTMPAAFQDISLVVSASTSASSVEQALREGAGELLESISLFDRYDQLGDDQLSLAYTMTFRAPDRTLTAAEVSTFRESAGLSATLKCGAIIRG